jgi:hypothetical protein
MPTDSRDLFSFAPIEDREVVAAFDGGAITSAAEAPQHALARAAFAAAIAEEPAGPETRVFAKNVIPSYHCIS